MAGKRLYKCQHCSMIYWGHELIPDASSYPPTLPPEIRCPTCDSSPLNGQGTPSETAGCEALVGFFIIFAISWLVFKLSFLIAVVIALGISLIWWLISSRLHRPSSSVEDQIFAANELAHLGEELQKKGNLQHAKVAYDRALVVLETDVDLKLEGAIIGRLANVEKSMGDFALARKHYDTALVIAKKIDDRSDITNRLNNLAALIADNLRNPLEAIPYAEQAVEMAAGLTSSPERLGRMLSNLAKYEREAELYEQARIHVEEAIRVAQSTHHPEIEAEALLVRSFIAVSENRKTDALVDVEQALAVYPPTSPDDLRQILRQNIEGLEEAIRSGTSIIISPPGTMLDTGAKPIGSVAMEGIEGEAAEVLELADEHSEAGRFTMAVEKYRRALAMPEIVKQPRNQSIIEMTLGDILRELGNLDEASNVLSAGVEHARQAGDPQVEAGCLLNLGIVLRLKGAWAESRTVLEQARDLAVKCEDKITQARVMAILGNLYRDAKEYSLAEKIYEEAERLAVEIKDLDLRASLAMSIGNLHFRQRRWQEAKPYYETALEYARSRNDAVLQGRALHMLGNIYQHLDMPDQAANVLGQALTPGMHLSEFDSAGRYNDLAITELYTNHLSEAQQHFEEAAHIYEKLRVVTPDIAGCFENLGMLLIQLGDVSQGREYVLKASEMDNAMINQSFALASEEIRLQYLKQTESRLNHLVSLIARGGPLENDPSMIQACAGVVFNRKGVTLEALAVQRDIATSGSNPEVTAATQKLNAVRAQIATLIFSDQQEPSITAQKIDALKNEQLVLERDLALPVSQIGINPIGCNDIATLLPEGSALVEFLLFQVFPFQAISDRFARGEQRYAAFVLHAKQPNHVAFVDLGSANEINLQITNFIKAISKNRPLPDIIDKGDKLRRIVFDILKPAFNGCERLFLAPDAGLARLPIEVLPVDNGKYLVDTYTISYLSTARDLLRLSTETIGGASSPLVVANPDFDYSDDVLVNELPAGPFLPLSGAEQEGIEVVKLLNTQGLFGPNALKSCLKRCVSPRVLHIASHGFYFEKDEQDARFLRLTEIIQASGNPLLRSGIALAGANTWLKTGKQSVEAENGILTAADVTALNLLNTELVVLSACSTGLGETYSGEGVWGLRRAFVLAGSKTLVMSLWDIPDAVTRELMVEYYNLILTDRQPRVQALRMAQLKVKEDQKYSSPYYWGAFISQGSTTPLPTEIHDT